MPNLDESWQGIDRDRIFLDLGLNTAIVTSYFALLDVGTQAIVYIFSRSYNAARVTDAVNRFDRFKGFPLVINVNGEELVAFYNGTFVDSNCAVLALYDHNGNIYNDTRPLFPSLNSGSDNMRGTRSNSCGYNTGISLNGRSSGTRSQSSTRYMYFCTGSLRLDSDNFRQAFVPENNTRFSVESQYRSGNYIPPPALPVAPRLSVNATLPATFNLATAIGGGPFVEQGIDSIPLFPNGETDLALSRSGVRVSISSSRFNKTELSELVDQWIGYPVAWINLDDPSRDPVVFYFGGVNDGKLEFLNFNGRPTLGSISTDEAALVAFGSVAGGPAVSVGLRVLTQGGRVDADGFIQPAIPPNGSDLDIEERLETEDVTVQGVRIIDRSFDPRVVDLQGDTVSEASASIILQVNDGRSLPADFLNPTDLVFGSVTVSNVKYQITGVQELPGGQYLVQGTQFARSASA